MKKTIIYTLAILPFLFSSCRSIVEGYAVLIYFIGAPIFFLLMLTLGIGSLFRKEKTDIYGNSKGENIIGIILVIFWIYVFYHGCINN